MKCPNIWHFFSFEGQKREERVDQRLWGRKSNPGYLEGAIRRGGRMLHSRRRGFKKEDDSGGRNHFLRGRLIPRRSKAPCIGR